VAVARKPSEAADRAIDAALPLLLRAGRVTVLGETEDGDREAEPFSHLQRLQQAGVPVTAPTAEVLTLQKPLPDDTLWIVP
jgi:hypothetical protein